MARKTTEVQNPNPQDQALSGPTKQPLQGKPLPHRVSPLGGSRPFRIPTVNSRYGGCADLEFHYPDLYAELEAKQEEQND